jgi:putative Holliday junction resolvase
MRYMGIDYGTRKVGIALSDEAGMMGFPHAALVNTADLVHELAKLIREKRVDAIVIGESRDFAGGENPVMEKARAFAERLTETTGIAVHFHPETYTTQEARRYPDGTRMPGSPDVDAAAAAIILTSYLERNVPRPEPEPNSDI